MAAVPTVDRFAPRTLGSRIPIVEIMWKFCGMLRLTGSSRSDGMFVRFRGQTDSHLCESRSELKARRSGGRRFGL